MTYEAIVDVLGVLCGELLPFVGRKPEEVEGDLTDEEKLAYEKFLREYEAPQIASAETNEKEV